MFRASQIISVYFKILIIRFFFDAIFQAIYIQTETYPLVSICRPMFFRIFLIFAKGYFFINQAILKISNVRIIIVDTLN